MAKIIKKAHTEKSVELRREFRRKGDPNSGFSFAVSDGVPILAIPEAEVNYNWCLQHPEEVDDLGILEKVTFGKVSALAMCECGEEIWLTGLYYNTTQCPNCGRWHCSTSGQEFNPPDEWTEDLEEDY